VFWFLSTEFPIIVYPPVVSLLYVHIMIPNNNDLSKVACFGRCSKQVVLACPALLTSRISNTYYRTSSSVKLQFLLGER